MIIIISAVADNWVIGRKNGIPWHIPEDFKLFKSYTSGNVIIYGRKTFESLGFKPLLNRHNIVVSSTMGKTPGFDVCKSLPDALQRAKEYGKDIYICGGAQIYTEGMKYADKLYISHVKGEFEGDTHFPEISSGWTVTREEKHDKFTFKEYEKLR